MTHQAASGGIGHATACFHFNSAPTAAGRPQTVSGVLGTCCRVCAVPEQEQGQGCIITKIHYLHPIRHNSSSTHTWPEPKSLRCCAGALKLMHTYSYLGSAHSLPATHTAILAAAVLPPPPCGCHWDGSCSTQFIQHSPRHQDICLWASGGPHRTSHARAPFQLKGHNGT